MFKPNLSKSIKLNDSVLMARVDPEIYIRFCKQAKKLGLRKRELLRQMIVYCMENYKPQKRKDK